MTKERMGVHVLKGNPLTLLGNEVKVGDKAPDFTVLAKDWTAVTGASFNGKIRLINVVPSLDTGICSEQTMRFEKEAASFSDVEMLTISCDLPFAQNRFCTAQGVSKVKVLSDSRDVSFGLAYGLLIKERRLLARSIFIVGADDKIAYVQLVKEFASHPNYDEALAALRKVTEKVAR